MRTFIAVDLAPEIKITLETLIRNARKNAGGVKWVKPEAMHLTLKFLGDIPEDTVGNVKALLERLAGTRKSFPLRLKGTGTFPPGGRMNARVLWAGIEEGPELMELQAVLEAECEKAGFPREDRSFHPHMTLGRVKFPEGLEPVLRELERYRTVDLGEMTVAALTFFQSVLGPSGPEYKVLAEAVLE
ncbi:MAG TPA: RNA 2',3'-cyclic phosphodiesterase [Acidobacteriota bacterium]|nr:RNA 2',3'-cyclic phosphodiesterase [Acidobacteriota bacterium]